MGKRGMGLGERGAPYTWSGEEESAFRRSRRIGDPLPADRVENYPPAVVQGAAVPASAVPSRRAWGAWLGGGCGLAALPVDDAALHHEADAGKLGRVLQCGEPHKPTKAR